MNVLKNKNLFENLILSYLIYALELKVSKIKILNIEKKMGFQVIQVESIENGLTLNRKIYLKDLMKYISESIYDIILISEFNKNKKLDIIFKKINKNKNIDEINKNKNIDEINENKNIDAINENKNIDAINENKNIDEINENKNIDAINENKNIDEIN